MVLLYPCFPIFCQSISTLLIDTSSRIAYIKESNNKYVFLSFFFFLLNTDAVFTITTHKRERMHKVDLYVRRGSAVWQTLIFNPCRTLSLCVNITLKKI